jgi:dCMP deaminase
LDEQGSPPTSLVDRIATLVGDSPERPSWDEYFMAMALLMAARSACGRLHVGCVLVSGGEHRNRLVAAGYNGFLPGSPHQSRMRDGHEQATVHAEQNAIADAARRGVSLAGATAYVSHFPCLNCAKMMAAAGIRRVTYHFDYNNDTLVGELLGEAGITIEQF